MTPGLSHDLGMAVKVLCDVRLACVVLMMIAVPAMGLGWEVVVMIGISLAMSYLLLRHWDPLGARVVRGWWYPTLESLVAILLFVEFGDSGVGGAYLGATLALLACAGGTRAMMISLGAFMPIIGFAIAGVFPTLGGGSVKESIWLLSLVVLQSACSLGGLYLRNLLAARVELVEQRQLLERAEASSRERLRLAHELHDGVAKTLHGCHMIAESLSRQLVRDGHPESAKARELTHSLDIARQESRDLLFELRQEPAGELAPCCRATLAQWAEANPGIRVAEELDAVPVRVSVRTRHEVLRILGELLENVRRHSRSPDVTVRLSRGDGRAVLEVSDHGVGIGGSSPQELARDGHFGLAGVRERAGLVGGSCDIESGGGGTTVRIGFPLAEERNGGTS